MEEEAWELILEQCPICKLKWNRPIQHLIFICKDIKKRLKDEGNAGVQVVLSDALAIILVTFSELYCFINKSPHSK